MKSRLALFVALAFATSCDEDEKGHVVAASGSLTLVRETRFADLLPANARYEASGVALLNGSLRVVFDNTTYVADIDLALSRATLGPGVKKESQYEGITVAHRPKVETYVVTEGSSGRGSTVVTLDDRGTLVTTEPTDLTFDGDKGIEGIAWLDDIERLLVLCEANSCGMGKDDPGHGVVKSLRREAGAWRTDATLSLPALADFEDYSDLAVLAEGEAHYRVAVVSQQNAALWLGELSTKPLAFLPQGVVLDFPRQSGAIQYCSIEGVAFLDRKTLAFASDRSPGERGCTKAEALHVFALP